jgi:diguanylate cyclase (GGDEF)-like protein/PAS domain S-box-containing protein
LCVEEELTVLEAIFRMELSERADVQSVSEGVELLLGYKPQGFLSSTVSLAELIHPHDADVGSQLFSPGISDHCGDVNLRVRHADGRIRCIVGNYTREFPQDCGPILNLTLRDAKELSKDGKERSSVIDLKSVLDGLDECVHLKDRNHVITMANRTSCSNDSGGGARDPVGLTDYDLLPEEIADESYELEEQILAGGQATHLVQTIFVADGKKEWLDLRKFPVRDTWGQITGVLTVQSVITGGVLAEQKLRENEASLREAERIARIGSYVLSFETGVWTRSEVVNEVLGIDESYDQTAEGWKTLVHPDNRGVVAADLASAALGETLQLSKDYRIVRPSDQAVRWVQDEARLEVDSLGRPALLRGTIRDITIRKQTESAARKRRDLLQRFISLAPAALAMFDREMRYIAVSRRWIEENLAGGRSGDGSFLGQEIIGRSHYEVVPDIPEKWKEAHRRGLAGEKLRREEDRYDRADGTVRWVRWEMVPWRMEDGTVGGIVLSSEDITALKEGAEHLRQAASVFTHAFEGILITDPQGTILDVNDAFTRITGYTRQEVLGRNPRILNSGRQNQEFYVDMWNQLIEKGHWTGEIWNRGKSGKVIAEVLTISAVPDAAGQTERYVALFTDISSIKEQEQQLERAAHYDLLTGLPNRVLLGDRLRQAMAQAHRRGRLVAIACLDLDGFRTINDRYGHNTGDQLLTAVTQRMSDALREGDTLARLGGDEFAAVMLDLTDIEGSLPLIANLLRAAGEPVQVGDLSLEVSASIGVTFFPQTEDVDADQLLRQSDQAMYQAKVSGKGRYHVFDPMLDRSLRGHHEDLERVRQALHSNELVLHFQPRVNMRTGAVLSAEALVRWQHPERGLLPPGQFMPIVEGTSLAIEVGEWVISNALKQIELWSEDGLDIPVSVNVDAQQLQHPDFVDRLRILLSEHRSVPPSRLELEVLESGALRDITKVSQVIRACNRLGVSFALDDFGTGYSSLSYLKRLPVHFLKIDQTFVHDMLNDSEDLTLLEGVLGLANAFRREAVAEGVETVEHGLMLLRLGCELAQGYGIARPMPGSELPVWTADWRPDPRWANVSPVAPANFPLLYASVEHRAWVTAIEGFLNGHRQISPTMDQHQCRFGSWLDAEAAAGRGERPGFHAIDSLHQRIHERGNELVALRSDDRGAEALTGLGELGSLRDSLLERLQYFVQSL